MWRYGSLLAFGVLPLLVLLTAFHEGDAKKIPRWWLRVAERQGPNACVVEEIPGSSKEFWTECRYWLKREICGKKTRIRFECCEGYGQIEGENGCTLVNPLKNILETAESLGATKWAAYIRESGLQYELESPGAFTLFAPTNEAFDSMKRSLSQQVDSYHGNPDNPILLYHIVSSKLRSDEFEGDQTVETRHPGHNIRINKYSNGMTTINCALLVRKDQEATNGIVHVIDGVLDPSVGGATNVADVILNDGRFQVMAEMLEKSGYTNVLRTMQDSITILAPSDEAFQKIPDSRREKIINDREARLALLQNHVVPHVICESAITGEHRVRTMSNNKLTFNCGPDGAFVEDTKLRGDFSMGKNGIIHTIDDVLLPDRAKTLVELAESRSLTTFIDFVRKSGLEDALSHTGDYTFFVPDEEAWLKMPPEAMAKAKRDPEYAGLMLRYHGAYGRHHTNAITDNQGVLSLDEENPVRLQVWRRAMGVEDAKITESDLEAQNGVIHIINKVIFPSNQSVEDILKSIDEHSFYSFLDILEQVKARHPPVLNLGPGEDVFYTFFVPTDTAFDQLDQSTLENIEHSIEEMSKLVTRHVAVNMFPATSFEPGLIYSLDGLGANFNVRKSKAGKLTVNDANVLSSHMSTNGVIHVMDRVFQASDTPTFSTVRTSVSTVTSHRGGSTSTRTFTTTKKTSGGRTHHKVSTVNEGFERNFEKILPAYPQGSVIVGSVQREPEHVLPPTKGDKPRRRENLNNRGSQKTRTSTSTTTAPSTTPSTTTSTTPSTTTTTTTTTTPPPPPTTTTTPTTSTTTSPTTTITTSSTTFPPRRIENRNRPEHDSASQLHATEETKTDILHVVQESRIPITYNEETHVNKYSNTYDYDLNRPRQYNQTYDINYDDRSRASDRRTNYNSRSNIHNQDNIHSSRYPHYNKQSNINDRYHNRQFIRTQFDNSYYGNGVSKHNISNSTSAYRPILTAYNRNWESPIPSALNTTTTYGFQRHATNSSRSIYPPIVVNVDGPRGSQLHSKTYSYSYSSTLDGHPINSPLHGNRFNTDKYSNSLLSSSSTDSRDNTIGPIPPEGGTFNYVGHHYGNDVVGHGSQPLPFSSAGSSFVTRNSSTDLQVKKPIPFAITSGGSNIHGVSTVTTRKRVGVTRTIYRQPSRSSTYLKKASRTISLPINKKSIPSLDHNGKPRSDLLSAYAFTDDGKDFADGAEFSEARVPSEDIIAIEQAKILRRQWRKKRHHHKQNKKNRKGRKRGGRRNSQKRRMRKAKA